MITNPDEQTYYLENRPEDCPPFEIVQPYLRYLRKDQLWSETWAIIQRNNAVIEKANDPFSVIANDKWGIATSFVDALNPGPKFNPSGTSISLFRRWAMLAPRYSLCPTNHQPDTGDFVWSAVTCFIAGAGESEWEHIVAILQQSYDNCPYSSIYSSEYVDTAHLNSGIPIGLGWYSQKTIRDALASSPFTNDPEWWMKAWALLHILKYLRRYESTLIIKYNGNHYEVVVPVGKPLCISPDINRLIMSALGVSTDPASATLYDKVVQRILSTIRLDDLEHVLSTVEAPITVLSGPWTATLPSPKSGSGFYDPGLRLTGAKEVVGTQVRLWTPEASDVLAYKWNTGAEGTAPVIPDTVPDAFPSQVFAGFFPNWDVTAEWANLLDTVLVASLIRKRVPGLEKEFPLVLFLPTTPTVDDSTNQGKSLAANVVAQAITPGIPITVAPTSSSAPDNRTAAMTMKRYGTGCFDEWRLVSAKTLLCHDNLQSLCTGGEVAIGEARENALPLKLKQSLVMSSKVTEFPPDLYNRSFPFFLKQLTVEQRTNFRSEITDGSLAMILRLCAIRIATTVDLDAIVRRGDAHRFTIHAGLYDVLWRMKFGKPCDLLGTFSALMTKHKVHTQVADEVGLTAVLDNAVSGRNFSLNALFESLSIQQVEQIHLMQVQFREANETFVRLPQFLHLRATLTDDKNVDQLYYNITGQRSGGRRSILTLFRRNLDKAVPVGERWVLPGILGISGFRIVRPHQDGLKLIRDLE